ncbi:DUF2971 domain-containing protein [Neorhizobium sp. T6_25]|uniref:DUF2971 domain-containing protein n=1 Tax=Neorhizobium sp. T6_25 TaxID=2093833 RepID=UPI000CF9E17D|nr:DUF2971 domain-containing protein [Neorhizobium sp. T6_25]
MAYRNYINLSDIEKDKPIYRIFPIARFIQLLTTKRLTLVKPKKWDDPFENLLLSSRFAIGGEIAEMSVRDSVYGQCWTWHRETDAMWRIYSPNKDGVRLRSTPRKLLTALKKECGEHSDVKCFIGAVEYIAKRKMERTFKSIDIFRTDGSGIAESLLYKRTEFSHEKEVRIIYSGEDGKCTSDIFEFSLDISDTFDRILFDPRMSEDLRKSYTEAVKALGFNSEIKRSTLYDPPKQLTFR